MFTSIEQLVQSYGVDREIAKCFVDRKVPKENAYWKGRLLYVSRGNGFLFIPLLFDLMHKAGVPKEKLLSEGFVLLMEKILDYAALYEYGEMDFRTHIEKIEALVAPNSKQPWLLDNLRHYFNQELLHPSGGLGDENPPLNRGDAMLFLFVDLEETKPVIEKIIRYWYSLVPAFLLLDDLADLQDDREKNEENSLQYYGYDTEGVKKGIDILRGKFRALEEVNEVMMGFFLKALDGLLANTYFQHILKA